MRKSAGGYGLWRGICTGRDRVPACSVRVMAPLFDPIPDVTSRFSRKADCGGGRLIGAPAGTNHMCRPDATVNNPTKMPLAQGVKFDN